MIADLIIPLFAGLITKHIIADYFLQFPFMFRDKGNYGAWGGIAHAKIHGLLTLLVFYFLGSGFWWAILYGALDSFLHYHIDYIKNTIRNRFNYEHNGRVYWMLHGTDQFLHMMTYLLLIYLALK